MSSCPPLHAVEYCWVVRVLAILALFIAAAAQAVAGTFESDIRPLLQKRWTRFAMRLTAQQAEQLVQKAASKRLSTMHVQSHGSAATDGWALERQGYRTADIYETEMRKVGTIEMGDAVVAAMK